MSKTSAKGGVRPTSKSKPKLLVANRSEIACRIFQACREMGVGTVAIVAPGDESARHVTFAAEVQKVAGYLDIHSIIEAAHACGATLIHPGYGFLSERPQFAKAVEAAGLNFVGPRAETMELMGGKISSKEVAVQLGVPVLPWARVSEREDLKTSAAQVGFPLLIKASAGGGGKGMRKVENAAELKEAAESARAEAIAAFGDGTLFLERYLKNPRHIEVQVFGDGYGGGVHLYERDCSIQRRHQKIWEEAPATSLDENIRQGLFQAALKIVHHTKYRSAGTLEFLVGDGGFYFLEMNTRLQVEHPVTEAITGVDLVHAQIGQAISGDVLSQVPESRGHSIEVRIYAEDPAQGFLPTPGRVERLIWPTGAGIRIDSGIEEGQIVGAAFDSMLAKLIVQAQTRAQALERLKFALEETVILGIGCNQNFLRTIADHPSIVQGDLDIRFLEREMGDFHPMPSGQTLALWEHMQNQTAAVPAGLSSDASALESPWFSRRGLV